MLNGKQTQSGVFHDLGTIWAKWPNAQWWNEIENQTQDDLSMGRDERPKGEFKISFRKFSFIDHADYGIDARYDQKDQYNIGQ